MKKVVVLSDTYGHHNEIEIPDGDILIHAGNFFPYTTECVSYPIYENFTKWFCALPHQHKIFARGKHDGSINKLAYLHRMLNDETYFLCKDCISIDAVNISAAYEDSYFSCHVPVPVNWVEILNTQKEMTEFFKNVWGKDPFSSDEIFITNHAPWGILDNNEGCQVLAEKVKESAPVFHVFSGSCSKYGTAKIEDTTYVNPSICELVRQKDPKCDYFHEQMIVKNKPIVLEINRY